MRLCRQLARLVFKSWNKNESYQGYQAINIQQYPRRYCGRQLDWDKINEHMGHGSKKKKSNADHYRDESSMNPKALRTAGEISKKLKMPALKEMCRFSSC